MEMLHGQAEALLPMVEAAMREAGLAPAAIDCVAVTTGPGSFTGIRVGIAAARGIALARDLPLIGVSSFIAAAATAVIPADAVLLVALESRRADLYVQFFDPAGPALSEPAAVLPEALAVTVAVAAEVRPLTIVGDAAVRAAGVLGVRTGLAVLEKAPPAVVGLAAAALRRWRDGERDGPVAPLYLRPPNVTLAAPRMLVRR
jgi:tRNA threonylcarbamoyladenosine biosynthesis protein TsaB